MGALAAELDRVRPGRRCLVALDGVDGVGKSHLAAELVHHALSYGGRPMVSVSIDGFHRARADRIAAGRGPEGFYRGSYRYDEFRRCVVDAVRLGQPLVPAVWDVARDEPAAPEAIELAPEAIVLVDGIFLQRPELVDVWDATVWVEAPFTVTVPRGNARFAGPHDADPEAASNRRYVGGQRLYLEQARPRERSTWVLDNTDLDRPRLTRSSAPSAPADPPAPGQQTLRPEATFL
ncbi:uridine kinase [Arsenicicoccus piscis]|uniref:uridine kinase n=1 Tax=Arsenicicoccus piscis TaxID=673954 RepID=UPI0024E063FA|nr:uridine kinase [Arsenicicoccus piscis]